MTIYRDSNCVIISHSPNPNNPENTLRHVYIGVARAWFHLSDGSRQDIPMPGKPHDDLTIKECRKLLDEMEKMNIRRCNQPNGV